MNINHSGFGATKVSLEDKVSGKSVGKDQDGW